MQKNNKKTLYNLNKYTAEVEEHIQNPILIGKDSISYFEHYNTLYQNIITGLIYSLISGDFYFLIDYKKKNENEILNFLNIEKITLAGNTTPEKNKIYNHKLFNKECHDIVIECLSYYQEFIDSLKISLEENNSIHRELSYEHIFNNINWNEIYNKEEHSSNPDQIKITLKEGNTSSYFRHIQVILFLHMIVAKYDEGYICNTDTLDWLLKYWKRLNMLTNHGGFELSKEVTILKSKLGYLIYKTTKRLKKTQNFDQYYVFDEFLKITIHYPETKVKTESIEDNYDVKNPIINHYIYKIERIYSISSKSKSKSNVDLTEELSERITEIEKYTSDQNKIDSVYPVHLFSKCVKYYSLYALKYDKKLFNKLVDLQGKLEKKYIITDNSSSPKLFEGYAKISTKRLLENSKYKLDATLKIFDVIKAVDVDGILKNIDWFVNFTNGEIKKLESDGNDKASIKLNNFRFQHLRFFLGDILTVLKESSDKLREIEFDRKVDYINLIKGVRDLTEKVYLYADFIIGSINTEKFSKNLPVYETFDECMVKIDSDDKSEFNDVGIEYVFIDSSYVLPSNYDELLNNIQSDIQKVRNEDYLLRGAISIRILQDYEYKLDDKVKENQINAIQIIGIYAVIITFILGSVKTFNEIKEVKQNTYAFFFVFSSCMILFLFLLKSLVSKDDKFKTITQTLGIVHTNYNKYKFERKNIFCKLYYLFVQFMKDPFTSIRINTNFFVLLLFTFLTYTSFKNIKDYYKFNIKHDKNYESVTIIKELDDSTVRVEYIRKDLVPTQSKTKQESLPVHDTISNSDTIKM